MRIKKTNTGLWIAIITSVFALCGTVVTAIGVPLIKDWIEDNNITPTLEPTALVITEAPSISTSTDLPTEPFAPLEATITFTPEVIVTETFTPTATPNPLSSFVGTWVGNGNSSTSFISFALERLVIKEFNENTLTLEVCRCISSSCDQSISLSYKNKITPELINPNTLSAEQPFDLDNGITWELEKVTKSGNLMLVEVTEKINDIAIAPEVFELKKLGIGEILLNCSPAVFFAP